MINKKHELRTDFEFFNEVWEGIKNIEIRNNDKKFIIGDYLILKQTRRNDREHYTGNEIICRIWRIREFEGLKDGYVLLYLDNFFMYTL